MTSLRFDPQLLWLALILLLVVATPPLLGGCVNPDHVLSINKVNLSFTRARVVDAENPDQPPDLDGDGEPDVPRVRPGEEVRKTVTIRNGSASSIPLEVFIDSGHPSAPHGGAFFIDTERSPQAEPGTVAEPFNYLIEANAELEITVLFRGEVEGVNLGRLQIKSEAYQDRERCDEVDAAGCIEVILQGTVDCTSLGWDADGDGFCVAPEGSLLKTEEDCEDDPEVEGWLANPGLLQESCEEGEFQLDTDCDGSVTLITDQDGDGVCDLEQPLGGGGSLALSCTEMPDNDEDWSYPEALADACGLDPAIATGLSLSDWRVLAEDDCDDSDGGNFPGNVEVCELGGLDEQRDDNCSDADATPLSPLWLAGSPPIGMVLYHRDDDGDGFGAVDDPLDEVWYCGGAPGEGFAPVVLNPAFGTGDIPCDPNATPPVTADCVVDFIPDCDPSASPPITEDCIPEYREDCDDSDVERFPFATVRCNGIDDDCDGVADEINGLDDSDADNDGRPLCSGLECSDAAGDPIAASDFDATVYAGAPELCDGKDNDCDGVVGTDEDPATPEIELFEEDDTDGDLYVPCEPEPLVLEICRCNQDAAANPSCNVVINGEQCANGLDDDGDGDADCFDDDCWGQPVCTPAGPDCSLGSGDCNDLDDQVNPGASELDGSGNSLCDFQDNDCDGFKHPTETDDDGDGNGVVTGSGTECGPDGELLATSDNDCDDTLITVFAGAPELCDGIDNNCNGAADFCLGVNCDGNPSFSNDGLSEIDHDGDGYVECVPSTTGLVGFSGGLDCNDDPTDPVSSNIYPGAPEIPDSYWENGFFRWVDNQCPGDPGYDSGGSRTTAEYCFSDTSSGAAQCADPNSICLACSAGSETDVDQDGLTEAQGDCDDLQATVSPLAQEICDGRDNDCDGQLMGAELDVDGDGYLTCWPPPGAVTTYVGGEYQGGDCDDSQSLVNPSGQELANNQDDDCDGVVDEGTIAADEDGDGVSPAGPDFILGTADDDCDDGDANNFPTNLELCDGQDNDCNGLADFDDPTIGNELDADGDGYSECADGDCLDSGAQLLAEIPAYPTGLNANSVATAVHPNAPELCDGWTNDCSELSGLEYVTSSSHNPNEFDNDGDGYVECDDGGSGSWALHAAQANELLSGGNDCLDQPSGSNPYSASVNPGVPTDVCDGYDTDCSNGFSSNTPDNPDEDDDDGDQFIACDNFISATSANLLGGGDCLDVAGNTWSSTVNPSAAESCDGYDTNCSGGAGDHSPDEQEEFDDDVDGYLECALTSNSNWVDPGNSIGNPIIDGGDCLDVPLTGSANANAYSGNVHPDLPTDACDGYDTDCNSGNPGQSFPDQPEEIDQDADGFIECVGFVGPPGTGIQSLLGGGDCLDLPAPALYSASVNPSVAEVCDGYDTDCTTGSASPPDQADELDEDGDGYIACANFVSGAIDSGENHPQALVDNGDCLDVPLSGAPNANLYSDDVNPGQPELCDGYDTDCADGLPSAELDEDGDGFIECSNYETAAAGTGGLNINAGDDCLDDSSNDYSDDVHPLASEVCDGYDTDCLNNVGNPFLPEDAFEVDDDNDGYIECSGFVTSPGNTIGLSGGDDCVDELSANNPYSGSVNPGAPEACDGYDSDCFGGLPSNEVDADGDGYIECGSFAGLAVGTTFANLQGGDDCDDGDNDNYPTNIESCDGEDEDCVGGIDNGFDADLDTFFDAADPGCVATYGSLADCNDNAAGTNPLATEVDGNDIDEDCSGTAVCFVDSDADGFGSTSTVTLLAAAGVTAPATCDDNVNNRADDSTDCNDSAAGTNPLAIEVSGNDIDEDCSNTAVCFVDGDGDGFGDTATVALAATAGLTAPASCNDASSNRADDSTDCNDSAAGTNPLATELDGNDIDEDCSGTAVCFVDSDADGFGGTSTVTLVAAAGVTAPASCDDNVNNRADDSSDCDDSAAGTNPLAVEVCDGVDNNCVSGIDDGFDVDGDTFFDAADPGCLAEYGSLADCNDNAAGTNPLATEVDGNDIDEDCSGTAVCFVDSDADGFGSTSTVTLAAAAGVTAPASCDDNVNNRADDSSDCDDSAAGTNPLGTEVIGNDIDEDCSSTALCFLDSDADGFGATATVVLSATGGATIGSCNDASNNRADDSTDCNDIAAGTNPLGTEVSGNDVDEDCSGTAVCFADVDGDGAGGTSTVTLAATAGLTAPASCDDNVNNRADDSTDCDDSDAANFLGNTEVCDAQDNNCDCTGDSNGDFTVCGVGDTGVDEGFDVDLDGVTTCGDDGNPSTTIDNDCDDGDEDRFPGNTETCNAIDDDCILGVDDGFNVDGDAFTTCGPDGNPATLGDNDCNDSNIAIFPQAGDSAVNGIDADCDGQDCLAGDGAVGTAFTTGPYYVYCAVSASQAAAVAACEGAVGDYRLAEIYNSTDNNEVAVMLGTSETAWIGATDSATADDFLWDAGSNNSENTPGATDNPCDVGTGVSPAFCNWDPGPTAQPDGGASEECVLINENGQWSDEDCSTPTGYLCEGF